MKTIEKFRRAIIEALHNKPYEEAIDDELKYNWKNHCELPITLSRVMQALKTIDQVDRNISSHTYVKYIYSEYDNEIQALEQNSLTSDGTLTMIICNWKLTKEDGFTTADETDQSEETLIKIMKLL